MILGSGDQARSPELGVEKQTDCVPPDYHGSLGHDNPESGGQRKTPTPGYPEKSGL